MRGKLELTLGPVFYHWSEERFRAFYAEIAASPIQRVYMGEVVCGKRMPVTEATLAACADMLLDAGKTVIWSTLALPASARDRASLSALAASEDEIEINDLSLMANRGGRPFTAGPLLNVYNSESLSVLVERGCRRLCANIELSLDALGNISRQHPGLDLEIFAFGRLPLALSGRCYHARAEGLHKDACRYVCDLDPNGRHVSTLDGTEFLAVNGIQTLSWGVQTLTHSVQALKQAGVSALRLSPQAGDMAKVIAAYHAFTDEHESLSDLHKRLAQAALPGPLIGGYWLGQPGAKAVG